MTTNDPYAKLRELISLASEASEKIFKKSGQLLPMYHMVSATGEHAAFACPDAPDKDTLVGLARAFMELNNVTSYVFINEAWILSSAVCPGVSRADLKKAFKHGIHDHPLRIEVVMYAAEDENGMLMAEREIIRPQHGKARLGPLKFHEGASGMEGRMVGLLPRPRKAMQQ